MELIIMRHGSGDRGKAEGKLDEDGRRQAAIMAAYVLSLRKRRSLFVCAPGPLALQTAVISTGLIGARFEVWEEALSRNLDHENFPALAERLRRAEEKYDLCFMVTNGKCASYFPAYWLGREPHDLGLAHGSAAIIRGETMSVWPQSSMAAE